MFSLILLAAIGTQIEVRDLKKSTSNVGPVVCRSVTGTVVNTSSRPLRNLTVSVGTSTSRIGTLKPGETHAFTVHSKESGGEPRFRADLDWTSTAGTDKSITPPIATIHSEVKEHSGIPPVVATSKPVNKRSYNENIAAGLFGLHGDTYKIRGDHYYMIVDRDFCKPRRMQDSYVVCIIPPDRLAEYQLDERGGPNYITIDGWFRFVGEVKGVNTLGEPITIEVYKTP